MVLAILGALGKSHSQITHFAVDTAASAPQFFGFMGCAIALIFSNLGACYGTAKSAIGIANLGCVD